MSKTLSVLVATLQFWIISPTVSADEIIKCQTPAGRIIYSDVPCEKQGAKPAGVVDATPNVVGAIKSRPVDNRQSAGSTVTTTQQTTVQTTSTATRKDPEERRRRERELGLILDSIVSTYEQKTAARNELSNIASLGVCILTDEQRMRRNGAYNDLGSIVQSRRSPAFAVLSQILATCERG